jgi:outer membrane protein
MPTQNKILIFVLMLIAVLAGLVGYNYYQTSRLVVVDVFTLVNEFAMKKELEQEETKKFQGLNAQVDSLNALIERCKKEQNVSKLQQLSKPFYELQYIAKQSYDESAEKINRQVWSRLNPLIDDFGKQKDYQVIIGGNGMGSVLYSSEQKNITKELINYVNKRYNDGK